MHAALFRLAFVATATARAEDCGTREQCEPSPPIGDRGGVLLQQRVTRKAERTDRTEHVVRFHKGNHRAQKQQDPCEVCTFNPSYVCLVSGQCWGYSDEASCQNAGGAFCQLPTCPETQMVVDGKCIDKLNTEPERWVRVHNIFRCMHGSPSVSWNQAAAANAQQYVNGLTSLQHSASYQIEPPAGPAGENLAMGQSSLEACTVAWYKEVKDCGWPGCQSSPTGAAVGHFTAIVWEATSEIGCEKNSNSIYICRYLNQPGNYGGAYSANVAQAQKSFDACVAELQGSGPETPHATPAPAPPSATPAPPSPTPAPSPPAGGCNDPYNWVGDNYCDKDLNTAECNWDGGDCAATPTPAPPSPTPAPSPPAGGCNDPNNWVGDKYCDADLNTAECNWDGGDCAGAAPAPATGGGSCATISGCEVTLNDASSGCSFTVSCSKSNGWTYQYSRSFTGQQSWTSDYSSDHNCLSCTFQVN